MLLVFQFYEGGGGPLMSDLFKVTHLINKAGSERACVVPELVHFLALLCSCGLWGFVTILATWQKLFLFFLHFF